MVDTRAASNFQISCFGILPAVVLDQQPAGGAVGIARVIHPLEIGLPWLREDCRCRPPRKSPNRWQPSPPSGPAPACPAIRPSGWRTSPTALRWLPATGHDILQHGDAPVPLSDRQVDHTLGDGRLELLLYALKCDHLRPNYRCLCVEPLHDRRATRFCRRWAALLRWILGGWETGTREA